MSALEAAQVLGKYAIVRELGRGGFATVYLAQDTVLRRSVALKILHPALLADPIFVQRFEQEAHATAQLDHPHIATIFDLGQLDGRLYIAMRLLSGGTLAERIKQRGPLSFAEAVQVVEEVAAALEHAHAAGFIHRDVKPTNILFDARGAAVLADFGMVKAVEGSVIARTSMGNVIGTPAYIAPEVWEGKESAATTDVYALGCVLFEMLTGELLFKGSTPPAVMLAHFRPHEYPAQWPAGTPLQIEAVLERALARDPAERYAGTSAFVAALRDLVAPAADLLAEPYKALQAALAGQEWLRAAQLAQNITAHDPGYRDVRVLAQRAIEGQSRTDQTPQAAQWRQAALEAERSGQTDAARAAVRRWLGLAPGDAEATALLERLSAAEGRVEAVPQGHESHLRDVEQQQPQDVHDATSESHVAPGANRPIPAIDRETTRVSRIWTAIALTIFAWIVGQMIVQSIAGINDYTSDTAIGVGVVVGTAVSGLCLGYISRLIVAELRTKQILLIAAGWAAAGLGWSVSYFITRSLSGAVPLIGLIIDETLYSSIGGIITAVLLRQAMPALPSRVTYILPIGWSIGSILGLRIAREVVQIDYGLAFGAVYGVIAGAIGGGVMFWVIGRARRGSRRDV